MAKKDYEDILSQYSANMDVEFFKIQPDVLNDLWGGGISFGAMYSLWGPEGSGKTSVALQIARSLLKEGIGVWWLDSEKALNKNQQETFKINKYADDGLFCHFVVDTYLDVEKILKAMNQMSDDKLPKLIILDSETMLQPAIVSEMSVTDNQPGVKAKQSNIVLNMMKQLLYKKKITSLVLFHARANITMKGGAVEDTKSAGGFAALHIPDVRTRIMPGPRILENPNDSKSTQIGVTVRIMCEKNKFTAPRRTEERALIFGKGVDKRREIIDKALELGIIEKGGGGFFTLPGGNTIRGFSALYNISNEILKEIQSLIEK